MFLVFQVPVFHIQIIIVLIITPTKIEEGIIMRKMSTLHVAKSCSLQLLLLSSLIGQVFVVKEVVGDRQ
jgi:hypothetical protein